MKGTIGVLDIQGGSQEHLGHLARIGVAARPVRVPEDLNGLSGIILPGGESTAQSRLLRITGMHDALRDFHAKGMKLWGTCAGAILLANSIVGEKPHLALMDIVIERNSFGAQIDSFSVTVSVPRVAQNPLPLTFIRAPRIMKTGDNVEVLLSVRGAVAAAEDKQCIATTFHPELCATLAFHRYFAQKCAIDIADDIPDVDPSWSPEEWMQARRR